MYIQAEAERYGNASEDIIDRLHRKNNEENFILNTRFKQCYFPAHAENLSLKFAFSGREFYEYSRHKVAVNPDNFLVINQGQEHASWIESENWVNSFAIYFSSQFSASALADISQSDDHLLDEPFSIVSGDGMMNFFQTLFPVPKPFIQEIGSFKSYLEDTGGKESFIIDQKLRALFMHFLAMHQSQMGSALMKIAAAKKSTRVEALRRIHIARDFIESFFMKQITIADVANVCFLSENMLMRYFKSVFGISIHQYIINKRLDFARTQIHCTDLTFNEITFLAGFECAASFGRLFKQRFGITPNSLRTIKG